MAPKTNPDLEDQAKILKDVIKTKFATEQERLVVTGDPALIKNTLVEYDKKLKVAAMDKFNNPGYACGRSYYLAQKDIPLHKAVGAVAIYILEREIGAFLKAFGYSEFDDENEEQVAEKCLDFGKKITDAYKTALAAKYVDLIMSDAVCARNGVPKGLDFSFDQFEKYEIHFLIANKLTLVAEVTMTVLPKR